MHRIITDNLSDVSPCNTVIDQHEHHHPHFHCNHDHQIVVMFVTHQYQHHYHLNHCHQVVKNVRNVLINNHSHDDLWEAINHMQSNHHCSCSLHYHLKLVAKACPQTIKISQFCVKPELVSFIFAVCSFYNGRHSKKSVLTRAGFQTAKTSRS